MNTTNEPITLTEAVRLVLVAAIAVLTSFEIWEPTPAQLGSILGLYAAVSVVLSIFARMRSTPTKKVALTREQVKILEDRGIAQNNLLWTIVGILAAAALVIWLVKNL